MLNHHEVDEALSAIGSRDHSVTSEYRIFGPPGTGKTTNLTRQIRRAVQRFGEASVLVTSFSRAAAAELARAPAADSLLNEVGRITSMPRFCWMNLTIPGSLKALPMARARAPHSLVAKPAARARVHASRTSKVRDLDTKFLRVMLEA